MIGDVEPEHLLLHGQELFAAELVSGGRGRLGDGLCAHVEETGLPLGPDALRPLGVLHRLVEGLQHLRPCRPE